MAKRRSETGAANRLAILMIFGACAWIATVAACSDGAGDQPAPAAIPERKDGFSAFTDLARAITPYLQEAGAPAWDSCLRDLVEAWAMPAVGETERCVHANTDDDPADEMIVILSLSEERTLAANLAVYDRDAATGTVRLAFESLPQTGALLPEPATKRTLLNVGDVNGDGAGDLIFASYACNTGVCQPAVYARTGKAGLDSYVDLGSDELKSGLPWGGTASMDDTDGDDVFDVVVEGVGGADPLAVGQPFHWVFHWNGSRYVRVVRID